MINKSIYQSEIVQLTSDKVRHWSNTVLPSGNHIQADAIHLHMLGAPDILPNAY